MQAPGLPLLEGAPTLQQMLAICGPASAGCTIVRIGEGVHCSPVMCFSSFRSQPPPLGSGRPLSAGAGVGAATRGSKMSQEASEGSGSSLAARRGAPFSGALRSDEALDWREATERAYNTGECLEAMPESSRGCQGSLALDAAHMPFSSQGCYTAMRRSTSSTQPNKSSQWYKLLKAVLLTATTLLQMGCETF